MANLVASGWGFQYWWQYKIAMVVRIAFFGGMEWKMVVVEIQGW